jgi:hypothetical protein
MAAVDPPERRESVGNWSVEKQDLCNFLDRIQDILGSLHGTPTLEAVRRAHAFIDERVKHRNSLSAENGVSSGPTSNPKDLPEQHEDERHTDLARAKRIP